MRKHGFTLLGLLGIVGYLGILALVAIGAVDDAEGQELDVRVPVYSTGVTVGPFHGGNSWPYTGTGVGVVVPPNHEDPIAEYMDWRTLQRRRAGAGAARLLEKTNFAFDSALIDPIYDEDLDEVVTILDENQEINLFLGGHTDLVGTEDYNQSLGFLRALAIRRALIERGVDEERLAILSFGETLPVDLTFDRSRENRRVEVHPIVDIVHIDVP